MVQPKVGVAWYRRDQWQKLLSASVDNEDLEETFGEWAKAAENTIRELRVRGQRIEKVDVDVDSILKWCQEKRLPFDSKARARFVAEKMRAEDA